MSSRCLEKTSQVSPTAVANRSWAVPDNTRFTRVTLPEQPEPQLSPHDPYLGNVGACPSPSASQTPG
ncbi:uncharacterized protein P884DRAFT_256902 [Thermothelomyces heterothallicus CBS 202.75]|uniref:uncharacterized protein n=1 Tax=Thermothelomyces heterothallicus CBS 202.75 TaxID=1149848 RepID=UPI003742F465